MCDCESVAFDTPFVLRAVDEDSCSFFRAKDALVLLLRSSVAAAVAAAAAPAATASASCSSCYIICISHRSIFCSTSSSCICKDLAGQQLLLQLLSLLHFLL